MPKMPTMTNTLMSDKLFTTYRERLRRQGSAPATLKAYDWITRSWFAWASENGVDPCAPEPWDVEDFVRSRNTYAIQRLTFSWLRATFRDGLRRQVSTFDFERVNKRILRRPANVELAVYSTDELKQIGQVVPHDQFLTFMLLAYTGCRRQELRGLIWGDVSFSRAEIFINGNHNHSRKSRYVPLHPALVDVLLPAQGPDEVHLLRPLRYRGSAMSDSTFQDWMTNWSFDSGLAVKAHTFRRSAATCLDEEGVRESVIDQIFGWAPQEVRMIHYTKVRDHRLYPAILKLYGGVRITP